MAVPLDYQNHYKAIYVSPCFFCVTASFSPKRLKIRLTPNSTSLPAVFFHLFPPRAMASCPFSLTSFHPKTCDIFVELIEHDEGVKPAPLNGLFPELMMKRLGTVIC